MEQLSPEEVKLISSPEASIPVEEHIITRKSKSKSSGNISKQTELF